MDITLLDLDKLLRDNFTQLSKEEPLIVIYLKRKEVLLGALAQSLRLNLADVLLGQASNDRSDILLLEFHEYGEARQVFEKIPRKWLLEGEQETIHAQLWYHGQLEAENLSA
jgi:hypothetical protein